MSSAKKLKTSYLWSYFTTEDAVNKTAKCDLCGQILNFKSTVSNLKKHLQTRHPTVNLPAHSKTTTSQIISQDNLPPAPGPSTSNPNHNEIIDKVNDTQQQSIKTFLPQNKKISETQKKKIDHALLDLFIKDYQPFSVVEDEGFSNFAKALNPSYTLPNRKTISNSFIPAEYEKCLNLVRQELSKVKSVCITTDTWTSKNVQNYIAVTAHFINEEFEFKSILLECGLMPGQHTSVHLANEIKRIINNFHLSGKVLIAISDNAADIKCAIKKELNWKHFGCFAHTLNLVVQDSLKVIASDLIEKIKDVVTFFKKSTSANEKLFNSQRNLGLQPKKLLQQVATRWNSTYLMICRFVELEEPVKTTIALINKGLYVLTETEWKIAKEFTTALKPFEDVTSKISGELYVTGSQVLVFVNGLRNVLKKMQKESFTQETQILLENLLRQLESRFANLESSRTISLATLLDPRFKLAPFSNDTAAEAIKTHCSELLAKIWNETVNPTQSALPQVDEMEPSVLDKYSIWEDLEHRISKKPKGSKTSAAIQELNRYLDDDFLDRKKDPLVWWRDNKGLYPLLSKLVKERFNVVATSVPCERIFSKAGNFVSERRTRLGAKRTEQLVFLNANKK